MDDPFYGIERDCNYSSSQEERLRHCRFCHETGVDPEFSSSNESTQGEGMLVDSTGIMMCSLPEHLRSQSEEFLTPQENLRMSSQEQSMNLAGTGADDHHKKLKASGDVSTDYIGTVDLGKDSDPGFSLEKSQADKGLFPGKEKEVLGFSGESLSVRQRISGEILGGTGAPAYGAREDNVTERSGDSALGKNLGLLKQTFEETISLQSGGVGGEIPVGNESLDTGFKENATEGVAPLKATDKEPEFGLRRDKKVRSSEEGGSSKKKSKGQSQCKNASKDVEGRRELPASIRGPMQNAAKRLVLDCSSSENQSLEFLMDTIIKLSGEKSATADPRNFDILETVELRGMTFPRPRWQPPERF